MESWNAEVLTDVSVHNETCPLGQEALFTYAWEGIRKRNINEDLANATGVIRFDDFIISNEGLAGLCYVDYDYYGYSYDEVDPECYKYD